MWKSLWSRLAGTDDAASSAHHDANVAAHRRDLLVSLSCIGRARTPPRSPSPRARSRAVPASPSGRMSVTPSARSSPTCGARSRCSWPYCAIAAANASVRSVPSSRSAIGAPPSGSRSQPARDVGRDRDEDGVGDRLRQELVQSDLERRRGRGGLHPDHAPIRRRLQHRRPRAHARLLHRARALDAATARVARRATPRPRRATPASTTPPHRAPSAFGSCTRCSSAATVASRRYGAAHRSHCVSEQVAGLT